MPKRSHKSRQRALVLSLVESSSDHPTADEIYRRARLEIPSISMGTVYRNLTRLVESGAIRKIDFPGRAARFDGERKSHHHVCCVGCGAVSDVEIDDASCIERGVSSKSGFEVLCCSIEFHGICPDCSAGFSGETERAEFLARHSRNIPLCRIDLAGRGEGSLPAVSPGAEKMHENRGGTPAGAPVQTADETHREEVSPWKETWKERGVEMKKYVCTACGYIYDPAQGDPDNGVEKGTPFDKLPEDWVCPVCGVGVDGFEETD